MVDDERRDGPAWGPRLLAPLAFFAFATVLVLVVQSSLSAEDTRSDEPTTEAVQTAAREPTTTAAGAGQTATGEQQPQQKRRFYRVRAGDTLESIAARFDTDVERLLELNPNIDPLSLNVGQRLRVR